MTEPDSLAKLAEEMGGAHGVVLSGDSLDRAARPFIQRGDKALASIETILNEWAARLDALRDRVLKCQTDEYEYLDKEIRSIAGAVSVGETTPREER